MMSRRNMIVGLVISAAIILVSSLYGIFEVLPVLRDPGTGLAQKIFYWHVPAAMISFIAFLVTLVASSLYLIKKDLKLDRLAYCSAELGLLFGFVLLVFGIAWDYLAWGVWWVWWDARLMTYAILILMFLAYFFLRSMVEDRTKRARYAAVFGIIAALNVPVSFLSTRLFGQVNHPVVIAKEGSSLSPDIFFWLLYSMVGFTLLYVAMLLIKIDLEEMRETINDVKDEIENGGR